MADESEGRMAEQGKSKSTAKARAAASETDEKPKSVTWRGTEFALPANPPGTLVLDLMEAQGADDGGLGGMYRILDSLIGTEGLRKFRDKLTEDAVSLDDFDEVAGDLLNSCLGALGIDSGESQASAKP